MNELLQVKTGIVKRSRKHYSQQAKKKYYKLWKASGLSQNQFCAENNLMIQNFSRWVKKLGDSAESRMSFIPVERIADKTEFPPRRESKPILEIQLNNGIVCRFSEISNTLDISKLIQGLHHAFITHSK